MENMIITAISVVKLESLGKRQGIFAWILQKMLSLVSIPGTKMSSVIFFKGSNSPINMQDWGYP